MLLSGNDRKNLSTSGATGNTTHCARSRNATPIASPTSSALIEFREVPGAVHAYDLANDQQAKQSYSFIASHIRTIHYG